MKMMTSLTCHQLSLKMKREFALSLSVLLIDSLPLFVCAD